jgi:hypothetical protein
MQWKGGSVLAFGRIGDATRLSFWLHVMKVLSALGLQHKVEVVLLPKQPLVNFHLSFLANTLYLDLLVFFVGLLPSKIHTRNAGIEMLKFLLSASRVRIGGSPAAAQTSFQLACEGHDLVFLCIPLSV